MTTPFDDLVRTFLSDLAEEAKSVDLTSAAINQARKRRTIKVTVGAVVAAATIMIGTPLALAASGPAPLAPASRHSPVPGPSPTNSDPVPGPSPSR